MFFDIPEVCKEWARDAHRLYLDSNRRYSPGLWDITYALDLKDIVRRGTRPSVLLLDWVRVLRKEWVNNENDPKCGS